MHGDIMGHVVSTSPLYGGSLDMTVELDTGHPLVRDLVSSSIEHLSIGPGMDVVRQARLTIHISPEAGAFLDDMKWRKGISHTQCVRHGLALLKLVEEAHEAGDTVVIERRSGGTTIIEPLP